ncbi:hypothetical protein BATDEDRAFT_91849 [Batrachochytrium dendrobatidis JAM81]|uniref:Uncharacterized protein n=1 Tax=Batrachochytrium dendrobatidis (strain JAM81 / FGSC 10211) TaxID=684364 RepID=F4PBP7_BATDJ|nr:uncharacterized protein BATDEDRAFT_91849 [Batrachochytrium dendrobatidis JAM81]EGF77360.1 hypothetical protein BATDEDRAFT_91849 [Batrachochytrium dendrobatidis JAM81]|eukprot:XP_006682052.1 hypothetical protein BATDEDRAFT_91849 [Batrachochytrium dendrobatidis JAM81]
MKLTVAVLTSLLVACSVTTANPILPSATTSTESSSLPAPNGNGIGLQGLDSLPAEVESLLEKYSKKRGRYSIQLELCKSIESQFTEHQGLVKLLEKEVGKLRTVLQSGDGDLRRGRNGKMEGFKADLENLYSKYSKIEREKQDCDLDIIILENELNFLKVDLVKLVFGVPYNAKLLDEQFWEILAHSTVDAYLETCDGEQSSGCKKSSAQAPSDQQESQAPQPSPEASPETSSPEASPEASPESSSMGQTLSTIGSNVVSRVSGGAQFLWGQIMHDN